MFDLSPTEDNCIDKNTLNLNNVTFSNKVISATAFEASIGLAS